MSANLVSKIDIDVLVHLAVHGPQGAVNWQLSIPDPDALGAALWQQNYDAAADPALDPPLPEYHFEPLPFAVTAVEGLKAAVYYGYQTADDPQAWRKGPARGCLEYLESLLAQALPGWDEAPWGWEAEHVAARMSRGGAPAPAPEPEVVEEDPLLAEVTAAFQAAGITLTEPFGDPRPLSGEIDPRLRTGWREVRFPSMQAVPILDVETYRDEATAQAVMRTARANMESQHPANVHRLARFGRTVVHHCSFAGREVPGYLLAGVTALGTPDELWTSADPPITVGPGRVLATRVPVTAPYATTEGRQRVVVGQTTESIHAVAALIGDDAVRAEVLATDPRRHTVLLLLGVASVDSVDQLSLHDRVAGTELILSTTGGTPVTATVLVADPLPRTPTHARLHDPGMPWQVEASGS